MNNWKLRAAWHQCVVPGWMSLVATDAEFLHLLVRDGNTGFIFVGVQHCFDPQTAIGPGGSDEIDALFSPARSWREIV